MASPAFHPGVRMEGPPPAAAADPDASKTPTVEERLAELETKNQATERELSETRESAKVWEAIANGRQSRPAAADTKATVSPAEDIDWGADKDPDAESDDVTAEALLDDLSKTGIGALKKHGFVRRSEVVRIAREEGRKAAATASTQVVQRARSEVTTQTRQERALQEEFPELSDKTSELYKLTARNVRDAVDIDPEATKSASTLILAARAAKAELGGKTKPDAAERRTQRDEHIAAQHGDRGRGARSTVQESAEEDPGMNEDELSLTTAMGVSPADFKKNQKILTAARGKGKR